MRSRRCLELGVWLLVLTLPCVAGADALDQARKLALEGQHGQAREAAREVLRDNANDPEALQIVVVSSCELGDATTAMLAYKRLATDVQSMAARHCARRGIDLTGAATTSAPGRADAPAPAPATSADPRRPWRVAMWTTAAASLAALTTTLALGFYVSDLNDEKVDLVIAYRMRTGDNDWGSSDDVCAEADADNVTNIAEHCRSGERAETAANVMLALGLVGLAASGYLYYRGYIKEERTPKVSFAPLLSPSSGGLSLRLSF